MMRFSKNLLLVLGSVAGIAFVALMVYDIVQINQLHAVAVANRSAGFANPRSWVMIGALLGLVAGLLLGMGIAMPNKTFKARYAEARRLEAGLDAGEAAPDASHKADKHVADARESQSVKPASEQVGPEQSEPPQ